MPEVVVIGGPNGSGKTTLTTHLLQRGRIKTEVINPDAIALERFGSYEHHIKAAKAALIARSAAIEIEPILPLKQLFRVTPRSETLKRLSITATTLLFTLLPYSQCWTTLFGLKNAKLTLATM